MTAIDGPVVWGLAAALGGGLLIGLERERRKQRRHGASARQAAGVRSFTLVAFGGGLAQASGSPWLVGAGALAVAALAVVAYARSLRPGDVPAAEVDPGLTTEWALFVTYLVGVLAVAQTALGVGAAVVVATLLALRERLHRFATRALSEAELHDALLLAALALVLLPLAPAAPLASWLPLAPRTLLLALVLILAVQAAGHVAARLLGERLGVALSGLLGGFVSSTATIVAMGSRVRAAHERGGAAAGAVAAALLSTVATWLQALLLVGALAPAVLAAWAPPALAGAALAAAVAALVVWRAPEADAAGAHAPAGRAAERGPLRLREALLVAVLLALVAAGVTLAQQHLGAAGLLTGTALAALADAHAPVAALATLQAAGQIEPARVVEGALLAVGVNALSRTVAAVAAGGGRYGAAVGATLAASWGLAAALAWGLRA